MSIHLPFDFEKATQALNFFSHKAGGRINKTKAIKLIFLADRYHLRKWGRLITNDGYYAMYLGPVPSTSLNLARMDTDFLEPKYIDYATSYIQPSDEHDFISLKDVDEDVFSDSDIEALEFAWNNFGSYDYNELINYTHEYPEWKKHEAALGPDCKRVEIDIEDFFEDPKGDIDKCYELGEEDKEIQKIRLKELAYLESLWE